MSGLIPTFLNVHNKPGKASVNHYQSEKSENPYDESTRPGTEARHADFKIINRWKIAVFKSRGKRGPQRRTPFFDPNREKRAYLPSWGCRTSRSFRHMNSKSLKFRHSRITQKKRNPTARTPFQPQPQRNRHISQLGPERRHVIGEIMPETTQEKSQHKKRGFRSTIGTEPSMLKLRRIAV